MIYCTPYSVLHSHTNRKRLRLATAHWREAGAGEGEIQYPYFENSQDSSHYSSSSVIQIHQMNSVC